MNVESPLYNSRITKTYIEYLKKYYPDLDIEDLLNSAFISRHEVEDPAHWFTQQQSDSFQEVLITKTGNPNISRNAGRYTTSHEGMGPAKQYTLGLMSLTSVYLLMGKVYPLMSRGAFISTKKIGSNQVEIISTPTPGVKEKPYQCEYRIGTFESLAKLFTDYFAKVDHPSCLHKGDKACRYIITWKKTRSFFWKRFRNLFLLFSIMTSFVSFFFLPFILWENLFLLCSLVSLLIFFYSEYLEKKELIKTVETQGNAAQDLINEMNIRHNNALLIQEIGQATSTILNIDTLLDTVMNVMQNRLDFDRGLVMLANKDKTRLVYKAGYGYSKEQEALLENTHFHLDKPSSRGVFVLSYKQQKPFLVNNILDDGKKLSPRSRALAEQMGVQSLICVPIIYEKDSLGILCVDNIKSKTPHTQSDISLLQGVAAHTAVSIINAFSFQKLQQSEKKYRELVENANSIIMRHDINGIITFFNEFAQKFFGYNENEILGKNAIGTILPETREAQREFAALTKALQKDTERQFINESQNILSNGKTVWIAWTYKPIFDENGNLLEILCIGNDTTELKCSEQEKMELEIRLQRAQKMEAIGTLAGGVAHDLNNILSGLVSYPELLLMDIPHESPLRKPLLTIQKSGEKAASIVQDLLTLARRGVSVTNIVNLNEIISEYLKSPEFEKLQLYHPETTVTTQLDTRLLNILGSPVHLSKTIMNLVSNAAEAMPKGGTILIKTENQYVDKPINGYEQVKEGDYVTLTVSDTGIGISPKDLERIFEPFYSKKVMGRSGTGLGMAVIWGTVKDHSGFIDVKSMEGEGTTFTLYFFITRKERISQMIESPVEELIGKGESVLIIDDVEEQRVIASEMLKKLGYDVSALPSGEAAIDYMRTHSPDILVLDMIMAPGIDGLDTYKKILEFHPGQKAIIVSGFSESDRVKKLQKLGAGAYVKKPYLLETLGKSLRAELDK
ncbi:MAG: ATP-binding protein [Thermodesulfobacteriota bacterium]